MDLIKKLGAFSIGPIVSAFIGFITVPLVTNFISPEEYGKASMFSLVQGILSMIIYLGMDQAFVREFFVFPKNKKNHLMANAMILPLFFVLVLEILLFIFRYRLSFWMFSSKDEIISVYILMALLPIMIVETFSLFKIRLEEKGLQYSLYIIALKLMILILTILLFTIYEKSFRAVVYALGLAEIFIGIILYFTVMKKQKLSKQTFDFDLIVRMLKFGLPLIPASLMIWILNSMDKVMLKEFYNFEALGIYSAAFKIITVLSIIQTCFRLFWTPIANKWNEEGKELKYFTFIAKLLSLVMFLTFLLILIFKDIIIIILSKDYREAVYVVPFLLLYPIMSTICEITFLGIIFARKTFFTLIISSITAVTNIVLNFLLIHKYSAVGAAIATGISYTIYFWIGTLISRKLWYNFSLKPYVILTLIMLLNSTVHVILDNYIPHVISVLSAVLYLIANKQFIFTHAKTLFAELRNKKEVLENEIN